MHKRTCIQLGTALALVGRRVESGHADQLARAREGFRALATCFERTCELHVHVHVDRDSVRERERESVPVDEQREERRGVEPLDGSGRGPTPSHTATCNHHSVRGVRD